MWPFLVVLLDPIFCLLSHFIKRAEEIDIKHGFAVTAVESFNESILHRLTRANEFEVDTVLFSPLGEGNRNHFRAVVEAQLLWAAARSSHEKLA